MTDTEADPDIATLTNVAFDMSSVAMFMVDDSLRIVMANAAAQRMMGPEPLIGRSMVEFSVAANIDRAEIESLARLSGEPTHLERETDLVTGAGDTLQVLVRLDPVQQPSGRRFFLTQIRDVTAERQQERALAAGEALYRQLVENLPDSSVLLFDKDLRLTLAAGGALAANGISVELSGVLMRDAFPAQGMDVLEGNFRAALAGQATDFTYASPVGGRLFRARVRPVLDPDGEVVGGLSVMEDVTADEARVKQLDQISRMGHFAGNSFDRRSGWAYDDALLDMWGIDNTSQLYGFPVHLLTRDRRTTDSDSWEKVITVNGPHTLSYSITHGRTGEPRHLQCTAASVVDGAGVLLNVVLTHVDVTDAVLASRRAELEQAEAAKERLGLLRQISDMLTASRLGPTELLQTIVDLAAATIGEGAAIRVLSPDHRTIERDVTAHPNESIRRRLATALQRSARDPIPTHGIVGAVMNKGKLLSDIRAGDWRPEYQQMFTERVFDEAAHVMVAPIRHNGTVLGLFAVFRTDPSTPYRAGDDDVLQYLADGAGNAVAEDRIWQKSDREREQRVAELRRQHLELLEKLAGMEARERTLLAEAIHDEPIQRIVGGILRLDHLSTRLDPATRLELDEVTDQLTATVDWLRELIVVALKPPDLTSGLGPALASLAQSIFTATPTVFTVHGSDHVPLTIGAKEAAYRIFREALGNVRRHAHANNATLRLENRDESVVISLTDDGVGTVSLDAGTGHLGMATMHARANAENGQLHIESVPGLGTVVTLTLPALPADEAARIGGLPEATAVDLDFLRTIVVCDDHEYLRDAVKLVLADVPRFHVVGEAADGTTCLERVRDLRPDVLILDISMPGGGPELAAAAKNLNPGMYIVVFSGRQDEQIKTAMLAAGADSYVVKTGRLQPLIEALDEAVATAQLTHSQQS